MPENHVVPDRPPPGPLPGAVLGVPTGLLLSSIWGYGASDVALAVTAVFAGLVVVLVAGSPRWRPFGTALLTSTAATSAAFFAITWYGAHLVR